MIFVPFIHAMWFLQTPLGRVASFANGVKEGGN